MLSISCPSCSAALPGDADFSGWKSVPCPSCGRHIYAEVFPALRLEPEKGVRAAQVTSNESTCFRHPDHAAAAICDGCGAYMCKLCELPVKNKKFCPECFNRAPGSVAKAERNGIFLYDDAALAGAILPIITFWGVFISAPIVLWYSIVKFNRMETPYRRGKWKFVLAMLLALVQI
ncbi:MAG: hypothetical protein ACYC4Q_04105, partial [Victivallaceae bacterium]